VCNALCTIVAHNTAQNRPDIFPQTQLRTTGYPVHIADPVVERCEYT